MAAATAKDSIPILNATMGTMTNRDETDSDRIDSWKSICAYLERDVSTLLRWEKQKGLPIHRIPGGQRKAVYAFRHELDEWLAKPSGARAPGQAQNGGDGRMDAAGSTAVSEAAGTATAAGIRRRSAFHRKLARLSFAGVLVLLLAASGYGYLESRRAFQPPQFAGEQQLTNNGLNKRGLLTDGRQLFFGQAENGWYALVAMPVDGGAARTLWSPPANVQPVDLSLDGSRLLAFTYTSPGHERALWIVPLDGGAPHRLADAVARSAAFAPDGRAIAYAAGEKIYLADGDGGPAREVGSFKGLPDELHWSEDGKRLRFLLLDAGSEEASACGELVFADGMRTAAAHSLPFSNVFRDTESWTRASRDGAYFLTRPDSRHTGASVWLMQLGSGLWEPLLQVAETQLKVGGFEGIAFDRGAQRLFVLGESSTQNSFVRLDPATQEFREILPGISGEFLDYSRDGQWITYTATGPEGSSLWVSRADGSGAQRLTSPPEDVQLPRWSPDGKQIAYMAKTDGHPWRIKILRLDNGASREASEGGDNQGAPTWSPDGRFLVYGVVQCQPTHSCAVRRIDLATGKAQTLPGSEGMFTARWSPDGRWIAAMRLEQHQAFLFDVSARRWRKLAGDVEGTDLSWSADSAWLYANLPGPNARIVRVRADGGAWKTVADLRSQSIFNLADAGNLGFSVAPDNALILHRQANSPEIYAYELRER